MSQDIRKIIAYNVKKYRELHNFRREELSLQLGFDNSYISKLEHGKINITIDRLALIAQYLEVDIKDLVTFSDMD